KKAVRAATRMAILSKFLDREVVVVDALRFPEIGTKQMVAVLEALDLDETTCLVGIGESEVDEDRRVYLSGRNIPGVPVHPAAQFNAYEVLRAKRLLLTRAALDELRRKKVARRPEEPAGAGA